MKEKLILQHFEVASLALSWLISLARNKIYNELFAQR